MPARGKPWTAHRSVGCTGSWLRQADPGYLGHPQLFSQCTSLSHKVFGEREAPLQKMHPGQARQCCCSSARALPACAAGPSEVKGNRISTKTFQRTTGSASPHLSTCSPRQPRSAGLVSPSSLPQPWQPVLAEPRSHRHAFHGTRAASAALRAVIPRCFPRHRHSASGPCDSPASSCPSVRAHRHPSEPRLELQTPGGHCQGRTPRDGRSPCSPLRSQEPASPGGCGSRGCNTWGGGERSRSERGCTLLRGTEPSRDAERGRRPLNPRGWVTDPRLPLATAPVSRCPLVPVSP